MISFYTKPLTYFLQACQSAGIAHLIFSLKNINTYKTRPCIKLAFKMYVLINGYFQDGTFMECGRVV